jgi:hypothetical protein
MVFGSILNWAVGKTLDFTFDTIWWVTKNTGQGIYNAGYYLVIKRKNNDNNDNNDNNENNENNHDLLLEEIKEQNKLLKEEIVLLKQLHDKDLEKDLEKYIKESQL